MPRANDGAERRPSVYEVAERAGVSIATVSRVMRGTAPVAAATRLRVLQAVEELRWRPSGLARAFAEQSAGMVGIVFPDLAGPYYSRVIAGFEHAVVERAAAALILATHGRANAGDLVSDLAGRVDGLVVMGRTVPDAVVTSLEPLPVVLLARPPVGGVPAVRSANLRSAEALTRHLLDHGRRRPVFVGDPDLSPDVEERWRGVRRALDSAGIDTGDVLVASDDFNVDQGYKTGLALFERRPAVDAVICANDEIASGLYLAARSAGRRIPDDVAVTGWDDTPMALRIDPPLTTVRQPMAELGGRAAELLFDRMAGERTISVQLPSEIVIRSSCGCEPGGEVPPGTRVTAGPTRKRGRGT